MAPSLAATGIEPRLFAAIGLQPGEVLAAITIVALPLAVFAFARAGSAWEGIGKGRFGIDRRPPPRSRPGEPQQPVDPTLQAAEARQMLEAKSYRRRRRGEPGLDVEAELAQLLNSAEGSADEVDDTLRTEVRGIVVARNERRLRRGETPLDVDAETERQLDDLIGLEG